MSWVKAYARETLSMAAFQKRMNGLGAQERRDKVSSRGTIYWSPSTRSWLLAYRSGGGVVLEFFRDCPCGT